MRLTNILASTIFAQHSSHSASLPSLTLLLLLPTFLRDSAQHNRDIKTTTQATTIIQISALTFLISHSDLPTSVLSWVQFSPLLFHFLFPLVTQAGRQAGSCCALFLSLSLSYLRIYQVDIRYSLESHYCYKKFLDTFIEATTKCVLSAAFALLCLFKYFTRHLIIIILMHRPVSRSQEHCPKETKRKVCWAELKVIFREMSSWHS